MGGYDRDGPQLYMIEPSGVAYVGPQSLSSDYVHPYYLYSFLTKLQILYVLRYFQYLNALEYC